ncbi:hypothetical protein [Fluviicola taffensis]|uniref:Lipoprotein n=1 Tax=Fluviicola taffensis (strain DSM 16823 / NCIMB 13979 / RW262) TaxID=755732 RepID=F2IAR0_FLUTR|nr:hypothetical protein [Fluviicola taffensis]AEA44215.1 hypothetical protein Fluta_2229 [Fluviicola taffensis DSM 16823]
MKMIKYLFTALTICLLISCSTKNATIKQAQLQLKSPKSCYWIKMYQDKEQHYYYTFDFLTQKIIMVYNKAGYLVNEINLTNFEKENSIELIDVLIVNHNHFIFLANQNKIFITDSKLTIQKEYAFFNQSHQGHKMSPFLFLNDQNELTTFILSTWPDGIRFKNSYLSGQYLHAQPHFAKINIENGKMRLIGKNLSNRFLKPNELEADMITRTCTQKGSIIYNTAFTDTIYEISPRGKIKPLIRITSKIGNITVPVITAEQHKKDASIVRSTFVSSSYINRVFMDDYRKLAYVIIRRPLEQFEDFPFNILIYDENWEKLDELEFKGDTYRFIFLVTKDGLLMERANNNSEKRVFDCLEYTN